VIKATLKEYADWWLENHAKHTVASSTYQEYSSVLKKHVYPLFGDKPFSKVSRAMIRQLISVKRGEGLSPATIRNILAPVRGMYNQAADDGEPIANPASRIGKHNKSGIKKGISPLSREETSQMLQKALIALPKLYPLFLCAVRTGLRQGELIALKGKDVDFEKRLIRVERAMSRGIIKTPKSGKSRMVDMSKQLSGVLRELEREPEDLLFPSSTGTHLDRHNLGNIWRDFLKTAELRQIRFHDLRHTFATLHLQAGVSPVYVKEQMGHSSIKVTVDIYGHWLPSGDMQIADGLDDQEEAKD
jgi:integrase